MQLTRRATLSLACLAVFPARPDAATCTPVFPGLSLCDGWGWRIVSVTGASATLTSGLGFTATLTFRTGLNEDLLTSEGWMALHAPISARANVLAVGFFDIDGRIATTAAYLPRHLSPPAIVALTSWRRSGTSLSVWTQSPGESYSDLHRQTHEGLLAALQLDLPE